MKPYTTAEKILADFDSVREAPGSFLIIDYHFHPRSSAARLELMRNQLFQNNAVRIVRVWDTSMDEPALIQLMSYFAHCPKLRSLEFIDIRFNRTIIDALLTLLQTNTSIATLGIWRNEITLEDLQYLLSSLVTIRHITKVKCHQSHLINVDLARALAFMLQHHHLRHFVWPINSVNSRCMQLIGDALRANESLKSLYLTAEDQGCHVQHGALNPLLIALKRRKNPLDMALGVIEGDNQLRMLASFIQRNNAFRELRIMNSLTTDSLQRFSAAIEHNNSLGYFYFDDHLRGSDEFDDYENAIEDKTIENSKLVRRLSYAFAVVTLARIFLAKAHPTAGVLNSPILAIPPKILVHIFQNIIVDTFTDLDMMLLFRYAAQFQSKLTSKYEMADLLNRNHLFSQPPTLHSHNSHPTENTAKRARR